MTFDFEWDRLEQWQRDLLRGAEILRERGLVTDVYISSGTGQVCAVWAIAIAQGRMTGKNFDWNSAATNAAHESEAVQRLNAELGRGVEAWVCGKTTETVASTMERVALANITAEVN